MSVPPVEFVNSTKPRRYSFQIFNTTPSLYFPTPTMDLSRILPGIPLSNTIAKSRIRRTLAKFLCNSLSLFLPQNFLSRVIPHSLFASSKEESSACPHVKCFSFSSVSSVLAPSLPLDSLSKISKSARHGRRDRGGLLLLLLLLIPFTRDKGRVVVDVGRGRIHCVRRYRDE